MRGKKLSFFIAVGIMFCILSACGKYAPPYAPEDLSPQAVRDLTVTASTAGISFAWKAPENDQLGKELRSMDGYRVYRKVLQRDADLFNRDVEFEIVATIPDSHVIERERLREQAREEGKSTRRIKVPEELASFTWVDSSVRAGVVYAYKLTPVNQGGEKGLVEQIVRVAFRGDSSDITAIPFSEGAEGSF